jgi:aminoglycoside phosphotransferase (APT) family kinase protein
MTRTAKRSIDQIRNKTDMVKKVIKHHFGKGPKKIQFNPAGLTNFVFDVATNDGDFIVRIATSAGKLHDYQKEQWAVKQASQKGVPVAEILEVGCEVIPLPYMLQRKLKGLETSHHPDRHEVLKELGSYAKLIHSIPTCGYGKYFDWSQNTLSKNKSWKIYLNDELEVLDRLAFLEKNKILSGREFKKVESDIRQIEKWNLPPRLNHGDLRLKNVITNEKGKILALIDWENCLSHMAPYWDFSIALHDLSIDGKQYFLEGYGIKPKEFQEMTYALRVFNLLNYVPEIKRMVEKGKTDQLNWYKLRLSGSLDLF